MSGVFQIIYPPNSSPPSECVLPLHQRRGVHTSWVERGWGPGVYILEDARHWIGLLQYNLSTPRSRIYSQLLAGPGYAPPFRRTGTITDKCFLFSFLFILQSPRINSQLLARPGYAPSFRRKGIITDKCFLFSFLFCST